MTTADTDDVTHDVVVDAGVAGALLAKLQPETRQP